MKRLYLYIENFSSPQRQQQCCDLLRQQKGIRSVSPRPSGIEIQYEEGAVDPSDIRRLLSSHGFQGWDKGDTTPLVLMRTKGRLLLSALFLLLLIYANVAVRVHLPFPGILWPETHPLNFGLLSLLLFLPVLFQGRDYLKEGALALLHLKPTAASLMTTGVLASVLYSLYSMGKIILGNWGYSYHLYFDSAAAVLVLGMAGKYIETFSQSKAKSVLRRKENMLPKQVFVMKDGQPQATALSQVQVGDLILLSAGEMAVADGVITRGRATLEESLITGDQRAQERQTGDAISCGSICHQGVVEYRADKLGENTLFSRISNQSNVASCSPLAQRVDKIAGLAVFGVLGLALISALCWMISGAGLEFSLCTFASVVVIACPSAMAIAVPLSFLIGEDKGARMGILSRQRGCMERLSQADTLVFDKAGIVTQGDPQVADVYPLGKVDRTALLSLAASVAQNSNQPMARAICQACRQKGGSPRSVSGFRSLSGLGVMGTIGGVAIVVGTRAMLEGQRVDLSSPTLTMKSQQWQHEGKTILYVALAGHLLGAITLQDEMLAGAKEAISQLRSMGIKPIMLTQESRESCQTLAKELGLEDVIAQVLPQEKEEIIRRLKRAGGKVALLLSQNQGEESAARLADVVLTTQETSGASLSHLVLLGDGLQKASQAFLLSRVTMKAVERSLFFAFCYHVLCLPLAAGLLSLLGGPAMDPAVAAIAMVLSTICVLFNGLWLYRTKI